jgi:hypothetical protein
VISESTARRFWPESDPIGRTLDILPASTPARLPRHTRVRVIGVVEDVVAGTLFEGVAPTCVYFPTARTASGPMSLLVRGRGEPAATVKAIAAAMHEISPAAAFQTYELQQMVGLQVWGFRAFSAAALVPSLVGLLLAFTGTYGVIAFLATQRTREFGIRMALGASALRIVSSMVGEAIRIAMAGAAIGLLLAFAFARASTAALEIVPIFNVGSYVSAGAAVLTAALVAGLIPALRAAHVDPAQALRAE